MAQAAGQDADESIAQDSLGVMVKVAGGPVLAVEGPCSEAVGQRAEGPVVDGVTEAFVATWRAKTERFLPAAVV